MKQHSTCTIVRTIVVTHNTMNMVTGEMTAGRKETKTEPCNTPIFTDEERHTGICKACRQGWEVEGNKFASEAEKKRATT